jgi:magnesium transporter
MYLLDLKNSLVYFSTSLRSNQAIIDKLVKLGKETLTEEDQDLWEDVGIEYRQAIEMCMTYRDILVSMMDALASVISNNLNIVMKFLAVFTILINIPMMITSAWGMNVGVPWEGSPWGFWIVFGISIVSCVTIYLIFRKRNILK